MGRNMTALIELVLANAAFVTAHFIMSHPMRQPLISTIGNAGFSILYSVVSAASLAWVYFAYIAAPAADLPGTGQAGWIIATLLMIPALVLFAGSYVGNPAIPMPNATKNARAAPKGVFTITRHPMMWGFALWAASHIIMFYSWRSLITAFAMGFLALVGSRLQDIKKRVLMGADWASWESRTSYWPHFGRIFTAGALPWTVALILFIFLSWLHVPIGGIPAGIWRWF